MIEMRRNTQQSILASDSRTVIVEQNQVMASRKRPSIPGCGADRTSLANQESSPIVIMEWFDLCLLASKLLPR